MMRPLQIRHETAGNIGESVPESREKSCEETHSSNSAAPALYPSAVSNILIPFSKATLMIFLAGSPPTLPPMVSPKG